MTTADLIERALADLPATIRRRRGPLSYRQAANESGVSLNLMYQLEAGKVPNVSAIMLAKVLRWTER